MQDQSFEELITHKVVLWYENDRGLYRSTLNRAENCIENVNEVPEHLEGIADIWTVRKYRLADNLRESFKERMGRLKDAKESHGTFGHIADELVTTSMAYIDWDEIAERFLSTAREEMDA